MFTVTDDVYDALYSFKDYAAEAQALTALVERHHSSAQRLLDVGCATGLHLAALARRFDVCGVDSDPRLLEHARDRLPDVPFTCVDMCELSLGTKFDVITCLYASIAYVQTEQRLRRALQRFAEHLAPGGVVVVQPWYRSVDDVPLMQVRHIDLPNMKIARMSDTQISNDIATIEVHYLIGTPRGIERREEQHVVGIYSDQSYIDAFASAGLHAELIPDALGQTADAFVARAAP